MIQDLDADFEAAREAAEAAAVVLFGLSERAPDILVEAAGKLWTLGRVAEAAAAGAAAAEILAARRGRRAAIGAAGTAELAARHILAAWGDRPLVVPAGRDATGGIVWRWRD